MRILHAILSTHFAGSEMHAGQLASQQARMGHEVAVLIREGTPDYVARVRQVASPARVLTLPRGLPAVLESVGCWIKARAFCPDVIHAHPGRAASRTRLAARSVPHVATLHIDWRRQYMRCDAVICIADWQRAGIPSTYRGEVQTIWNSVPERPAGEAPDRCRLPHDKVQFLSVGRLIPNKGMDVLISAFRSAFPDPRTPVSLAIAGDGPEGAALAGMASADPRIRLLGYVPDVAPLYDTAHVYVSAARFEPFGLTVLEAMRAGCQLIATRTQGPSEFLSGYDVTWAECDDSQSLADALRRFGTPPVSRRTWDMTPFSPVAAAHKIEDLYRRLLAKRATSAPSR